MRIQAAGWIAEEACQRDPKRRSDEGRAGLFLTAMRGGYWDHDLAGFTETAQRMDAMLPDVPPAEKGPMCW